VYFEAQEYRELVKKMSDDELIREGKRLRSLSGDGKIVSAGPPSVFDQQLTFCREEWRTRPQKSSLTVPLSQTAETLPHRKQ
jgi:hypothetical protein